MITDIGTVMWKEWKEILTLGGGRGKLGLLILVGIFGIFLPLQMGRAWVESPMMLFPGIWIPLVFVISVIADSFAGERERHTLETLLTSRLSDLAILCGKTGAAVGYGVGAAWTSLLLGLITVNLAHGQGKLLLYPTAAGLGMVVFSLLCACLAASAGILISLRAATVRQAQQTMSIAVMVLLFGAILGVQALPAEWRAGLVKTFTAVGTARMIAIAALALTALDAGLFVWAMTRFRRARLILD